MAYYFRCAPEPSIATSDTEQLSASSSQPVDLPAPRRQRVRSRGRDDLFYEMMNRFVEIDERRAAALEKIAEAMTKQ